MSNFSDYTGTSGDRMDDDDSSGEGSPPPSEVPAPNQKTINQESNGVKLVQAEGSHLVKADMVKLLPQIR